jgi:NAD(P)-dependent dehydrogenase (short-subunit alcohol dehydrogenase family)
MAREEFESIIATNVTGAMLMARAAARHFVKRRSGNIINIGSTAALRGARTAPPITPASSRCAA